MMSLRTWLLHKKIVFFGDEDLVNNGKWIPCKDCDSKFKSYAHFGDFGYTYDSICKKCIEKRKNKRITGITEKDRKDIRLFAFVCVVVLFMLWVFVLYSNKPEPSSLTYTKYDYFQAIRTFDLKPLYTTNCSEKSSPIPTENIFVTIENARCNYYDTRILEYYLACVKLDNHDRVLGEIAIDECGAMSVPVKIQ